MRQFLKHLLVPLVLVAVTQISFVSAESIRLTGPNGELQTSPQFSEPVTRNRFASNEPSQFYGPTSSDETLWRIASQLRPNNQVSVQQTLLAIYRLNPQAFENQNIHTLIPQSTLRIPSLAQVTSVSTQEAVNIMLRIRLALMALMCRLLVLFRLLQRRLRQANHHLSNQRLRHQSQKCQLQTVTPW
ncbi:FimV/HubP family polar landmark protein [Vibrio mexicanus]|uniref:FimV/HubP family polar landmark protein n=1 Tax=Vibrio mexicanus TaxID=1004326 RepID=UPI00063CB8BD